MVQVVEHSRPQSLRSFWPAAGIERLWEQPFQACAVDVDYVRLRETGSVSFPEPTCLLVSTKTRPKGTWALGTRLRPDRQNSFIFFVISKW